MSTYHLLLIVVLLFLILGRVHSVCEVQSARGKGLEPWASNTHPTDVAKRYVQEITTGRYEYTITHGGAMDGRNCRSPMGSWLPCEQTWESNRAVRIKNVGETDMVNPWLSNGHNNFRNIKELVAGAIEPGMSDREKAFALYYLEIAHRFHASTGDDEVIDPVKVFNVYGYTTCGNDSICLAGLWSRVGLKRLPARLMGHCVTQVFYDGRWHLMDADMQDIYLLRDNHTVAGEKELVRDHDLIKRSHTQGILSRYNRAKDEWEASLYIYEGDAGGTRDASARHTMNMVLRPNEALTWRWGQLVPPKFHGPSDIKMWGQKASDTICNGLWEYRPDFTKDIWRKGADTVEDIKRTRNGLAAETGETGTIVWTLRSPYVLVGGRLEVDGSEARFALSWDGKSWQEVGESLDKLFPPDGPARYQYRLRCQLSGEARLKRLGIVNDVQMAMLSLPGMVVGENTFVYTDESPGDRRVRITHEWVERSASRPPEAPPAPVFPADGGETNGTDIIFEWVPPADPDGDKIVDYHFELSDRPDMKWPLSPNFAKLISNTADRGKARYTLPYVGLLAPGRQYYWWVRAKDEKGVWGAWSKTWRFTPRGPTPPVDVTMEYEPDRGIGILRWKPNPVGRQPISYRVYGSDEKGFTVSDKPYDVNVGNQKKKLPTPFPANFVVETPDTELVVVGTEVNLPNTNKAFYRVVAVDKQGKRSWSSDYVAAPRPFIYSKPVVPARVGAEYRYQVSVICSLGDLRCRFLDGNEATNFWDIEKPRFVLERAPKWLKIDETTGLLSGTPDAAGRAEVVVAVTINKEVRRLDEGRLSWGQEKVLSVTTVRVGSATQEFVIDVGE